MIFFSYTCDKREIFLLYSIKGKTIQFSINNKKQEEMNLYEITQEQANLNNMLEESMGELTPELEAALTLNLDNFNAKAEGYVKAIKNYKAEQDAIAEEIKKLQAKKKVCENAVERMKDALKTAMDVFDTPKVQAGLFKISLTKSESVNIINEDAIPEQYKRIKYEVSKTDIKNAIKNGETVEGAEIVENKSITIR